jgi:hypothetical protein
VGAPSVQKDLHFVRRQTIRSLFHEHVVGIELYAVNAAARVVIRVAGGR